MKRKKKFPTKSIRDDKFVRQKASAFMASSKKRCEKKGIPWDTVSRSGVIALLKTCDETCPWCGKALTQKTVSIDHMNPLGRGGQHHISNLMITCKACNLAKGNCTMQEFDQLMALVKVWPDSGIDLIARLRRGFAFF